MSKKIITGGLGYIGTELSNIEADSGDEIIVVDNRFLPERVNWLRLLGVKYYHRDIFNCQDILKGADVVYHLAGITDVAYVATQSDPVKDALIKKIAIEGTKEVIEHTPEHCKIIFPSTHVIFEGLQTETLNIREDFEPCPVLTYATSKRQNEMDLFNSNKPFVIARLSSVYGYNESMRISIVPNLFSKMASQNQTIKLFGGGTNFKPLVGVQDVARFLQFLTWSNYNREIFHVTNENLRIKEIAAICQESVPELKIESTEDEIPNNGYTLSNQKLLSTGFEFRQNVYDAIGNMIYKWRT